MLRNQFLIDSALRYPVRALITIVLGFSGALFSGVSTALLVPILLSMLGQQAVFKNAPPFIRTILAPFDQVAPQHQLWVMALTIVVAIAIKNLVAYLNSLAAGSLARAIASHMQEKGLELVFDVDISFFAGIRVGDLMNRLGGEMSRSASIISTSIGLVTSSISALVFVGILVLISWQLTIAASLLVLITIFVSQRFIRRAKQISYQISDVNKNYSGGIVEVLSGIRLVKATSNEQREFHQLRGLIKLREKLTFEEQMSSAAIGPLTEVINVISLIALVAFGRFLFQSQIESFSSVLLTYLVVLMRTLPIFSDLNSRRNNIARNSASVAVVQDLLRHDNKSFMQNGSIIYSTLKDRIEFKNVWFSYNLDKEPVLNDINLVLPKGTTLALVGASGAGKSTIADLLIRFYDPTSGAIYLDGQDLRNFDYQTVRQAMGIVSQDTFLFNNTLRFNISYGCSNATEEDIIEATKRANAYEFIKHLPQGLDTIIGDRGVMLSGGQRQRVAIARALLQDPDILILDEATSALDTVSERLVQEAIEELSNKRTTLVIAHRLSTIQRADQIAVMERGKVIELGTHQELLAKNGYYSRLYGMQFSQKEVEHALEVEETAQQRQRLTHASYELRGQLNQVLGSLSLLADGLVESEEEEQELLQQARTSAIELLETCKILEDVNPGRDELSYRSSSS